MLQNNKRICEEAHVGSAAFEAEKFFLFVSLFAAFHFPFSLSLLFVYFKNIKTQKCIPFQYRCSAFPAIEVFSDALKPYK